MQMPNYEEILNWENYTISWRGGLFQMNPDPGDYGGQDYRSFFLKQFRYMLDHRMYDTIDLRLVYGNHGDRPIKVLNPATEMDGIRISHKKRRRK